ncbi:MAG: hypothetical protein AAF741_06840 [Bacteroidota bacterium]
MRKYISEGQSKTFAAKPKAIQDLINTTLYILDSFGIPMDGTPRRLERMALAFLACGDVKSVRELIHVKDLNSGYSLKTRDLIDFVNLHFSETISSGSYDDIRRKDLKLLTTAAVVVRSKPNSATNDSRRAPRPCCILKPKKLDLSHRGCTQFWAHKRNPLVRASSVD